MCMQGYARHSANEINRLMHTDLKALSMVLGDKPYLLGDAPCDADAAAFSALDQMVCGRTVAPELNEIVRQYPNLCQYTTRIHKRFFADKAPSVKHGAKSGKAV